MATASGQLPSGYITSPILAEETARSEMYEFVNAAIPPVPRFSTLAEWKEYRPKLQQRILRLIGADDILAKHSLHVVSKGKLSRDGYSIEKIMYETFPGMWVPALVWRPDPVPEKAPAMVSISGHNYYDSKGAEHVQARSVNLVKRGFIVLSYDYFGCWERGPKQLFQPGSWRGWEHTNTVYTYSARTPTAMEVLDGIRAVDYLYSQPGVDRTRIGFTGESGGGNSTYWISALDDRITLSVPTASTGTFEYWIKNDLMYDWHQTPGGLRGFAEVGSMLALFAPRPLLVQNGGPDLKETPLPEALRSFEYAKQIYKLYGAADHIAFYESSTTHGYQPDKRVQLYRWLKRWYFGGKWPFPDDEIPFALEPLETLRVGLPENNLAIADVQRRWVDEAAHDIPLPQSRTQAESFQAEKRSALEPLLARRLSKEAPTVVRSQSDDNFTATYRAQRLRFQVDDTLLIPAVFVRGVADRKYDTILVLGRKNATAPEFSALSELGYAFLFLDVRGTGEMNWGGGRTSNFADFVGRPAVGMWAEDVYKVTTYLLSRADVARVAVLGYDLMGKVALYAAAMDPRISAALVSTDSLSYWQDATSGLTHVFADVPRILTWGDTEHVAALVAPRPLGILQAGVPKSLNAEMPAYVPPLPRLEPEASFTDSRSLAKHYDWTRRFYELCGASAAFSTGMPYAEIGPSVVKWLQEHYPPQTH